MGLGIGTRRAVVRLATGIDEAVDLIPKAVRQGAGRVMRRLMGGVGIGMVFLYALANRERSFLHNG